MFCVATPRSCGFRAAAIVAQGRGKCGGAARRGRGGGRPHRCLHSTAAGPCDKLCGALHVLLPLPVCISIRSLATFVTTPRLSCIVAFRTRGFLRITRSPTTKLESRGVVTGGSSRLVASDSSSSNSVSWRCSAVSCRCKSFSFAINSSTGLGIYCVGTFTGSFVVRVLFL